MLKQMMKKGQILLWSVLLIVTVVACGGSPSPASETETAVSPTNNSQQGKTRQLVRRGVSKTAVAESDDPTPDDDYDDEEMDEEEGVDWFTIAADMLAMDDESMWQALMEGQSIAQLAQANNIDPQTISAALIASETEWIEELLASEEITSEEAAEWTAELGTDAQTFIEDNNWALWEGVDWFTIAAQAIGVDEETLFAAESIAMAAQTAGVEPQTVIEAIVAAETTWINDLLASEELTPEEADEWTAELPTYVAEFVSETEIYGDFAEVEGTDWFLIAQETLGMDEDALWEALDNGQTIADIANAAGVDSQTIIDAIIAAEGEWINELLADEELTSAEADEWLAELASEAEFFVSNNDWALWEGVDWFVIVQETLGMDEDAFWDAVDNGQSLLDLAAEQGVDGQTVSDALLSAETEWLNQLLADGELTPEEAAEWTAELESEIQFFLADSWDYEEGE